MAGIYEVKPGDLACSASGCTCVTPSPTVGAEDRCTCGHAVSQHYESDLSTDRRGRTETTIIHDEPPEPQVNTPAKSYHNFSMKVTPAPDLSEPTTTPTTPLISGTGSPPAPSLPGQPVSPVITKSDKGRDAKVLPPLNGVDDDLIRRGRGSLPGLREAGERGRAGSDGVINPGLQRVREEHAEGARGHRRVRSRTVSFKPDAPLPAVQAGAGDGASSLAHRESVSSMPSQAAGQTIPLLLTPDAGLATGAVRMGRRRSRTVNLHISGGPNPQLTLSPGPGPGIASARSTPAHAAPVRPLMSPEETAEILGRLQEKMTPSQVGAKSTIKGGDDGNDSDSDSSDAPRPEKEDDEEATLAYAGCMPVPDVVGIVENYIAI